MDSWGDATGTAASPGCAADGEGKMLLTALTNCSRVAGLGRMFPDLQASATRS
jgi:hypothetical protein